MARHYHNQYSRPAAYTAVSKTAWLHDMVRRRRVAVPVWCRWTAESTLGAAWWKTPAWRPTVGDQHPQRRAGCQPPDRHQLSHACSQVSVRRPAGRHLVTGRTTGTASQIRRSAAAWRHAGCLTAIRRVDQRWRTRSPRWGYSPRAERARRSHRRCPGTPRERQVPRHRRSPAQHRAIPGTRQVPRPAATRQCVPLATGGQC